MKLQVVIPEVAFVQLSPVHVLSLRAFDEDSGTDGAAICSSSAALEIILYHTALTPLASFTEPLKLACVSFNELVFVCPSVGFTIVIDGGVTSTIVL